MKNLVIISVVVFSLFLSIAYAEERLAPKTNLELYVENDLILLGQVKSVIELEGHNEYEIEVEKFLKNPMDKNVKTAIGKGTASFASSIDRVFSNGDRVVIFLNIVNEKFIISPYSFNAEKFDPDKDFIISPLKLSNAGINFEEIVCKKDLRLILKSSNGSAVCVKPSSLDKLISRGWGMIPNQLS